MARLRRGTWNQALQRTAVSGFLRGSGRLCAAAELGRSATEAVSRIGASMPKPVVYIASPYTKGDVAMNTHFQCKVFDRLLSDGKV